MCFCEFYLALSSIDLLSKLGLLRATESILYGLQTFYRGTNSVEPIFHGLRIDIHANSKKQKSRVFPPGLFTPRLAYEHPLVEPHVSHFKHVPFRTIVKFWHSGHETPS